MWYIKDLNQASPESVVEHVLNYGNWQDVQQLFKILGLRQVAEIFRKQISGRRCNYQPMVKNYFKLYFDKYA